MWLVWVYPEEFYYRIIYNRYLLMLGEQAGRADQDWDTGPMP